MSCGKSSVGRHLCKDGKMTLRDIDAMIIERAGMTIPEIFKTIGEKAFRDLESYVISLVKNYQNTVIATGGGVVLREQNRKILKNSGMVIWLKTTPENVLKYTQQDQNRPLLEGNKSIEKIREMMAQREPFYADCAHYSINTWENNLPQIATKVWDYYQEFNSKKFNS